MAPAAKVDAAFRAVQAAYDNFGDKLEALEAVINDEKTSGQVARDLVKHFAELWSVRYGRRKYVVSSWPQAIQSIKGVLRDLDLEDVHIRLARFIASNDPFYVAAYHPLSMFVKCVNKFAGASRDDAAFLSPPPIDCIREGKHHPPCRTEAQHTQRRGTEARRNAVLP